MTVSAPEMQSPTYIDRELSQSLNSTDSFEGPEKLLEIWFYPDVESIPNSGKTLRSIPFENWVEILQLVKCQVLSMNRSEKLDAYLLSESSLFVFDHKLTLKTCGTTTTLFCLEALFALVKQVLGWSFENGLKMNPYKVFYSRRCFMFPAKQSWIHRNWNDEVNFLDRFFWHGKNYLVGRLDQANHWNLYVTDSNQDLKTRELSDETDEDETLEILMTGLKPNKAQQFVIGNREDRPPQSEEPEKDPGHVLGAEITRTTKLDRVYDCGGGDSDQQQQQSRNLSLREDSFAFSPCGYSSNVIVDGQYYYTLHVTPEDGWSYASFESNVPANLISQGRQDQVNVIRHVLDTFQPSEFCLTFFARDTANENFYKLVKLCDNIPNYVKKDKIIYDLDEYQLLYLRFSARPLV
ncbi:LAMI_0E08658g1_1 [Lachancea mirantina]|uniref:adenosylmethionine decarboxylase n=1 Tax=Lachancea mirantina TaxID=1230905 RepID=A0A1G4JN85_9SACH|nr:LAMI_0E08658g1_1 [Lachancea mirantina]